jgi:hypothetical protein
MAKDASGEGMTLLGDAWFGPVKVREAERNVLLSCFTMCFPIWDRHLPSLFHMQAAVALGKMKRHGTGVVKTSHGLFPKDFI